MRNILILFSSFLIASGLFTLDSINKPQYINAVPPELLDKKFIFGDISGIAENENGTTEWIMVGNWRSTLTNDTAVPTNGTSNVFNTAIDMINADGTSRHTHTLTEFRISDVSTENNSTIYNGTSTISLREGPALNIPTSIQKVNDQIFVIMIDPESVDNHFGDDPIFGVIKSSDAQKSYRGELSNMSQPTH